jgi:hypothetical protein
MGVTPVSRAIRNASIAAVLIHTIIALSVWHNWGEFGRGTVLFWMDFPVSLLYSHLDDPEFLAGSLLLGGVQWALLAAGLTYLLGRSVRDRLPAAPGAGAERAGRKGR